MSMMKLTAEALHTLSDALRALPPGAVEIHVYERSEPGSPYAFVYEPLFQRWEYAGQDFRAGARTGWRTEEGRRVWAAYGEDRSLLHVEVEREGVA